MRGAKPPLPQYAFMAWCSVKAQGQLYLLPLCLWRVAQGQLYLYRCLNPFLIGMWPLIPMYVTQHPLAQVLGDFDAFNSAGLMKCSSLVVFITSTQTSKRTRNNGQTLCFSASVTNVSWASVSSVTPSDVNYWAPLVHFGFWISWNCRFCHFNRKFHYSSGRPGFGSRQGQGSFLFATASRPTLGATQPHIECVAGTISPWVKQPGLEVETLTSIHGGR
jgi:hypothetical protein